MELSHLKVASSASFAAPAPSWVSNEQRAGLQNTDQTCGSLAEPDTVKGKLTQCHEWCIFIPHKYSPSGLLKNNLKHLFWELSFIKILSELTLSLTFTLKVLHRVFSRYCDAHNEGSLTDFHAKVELTCSSVFVSWKSVHPCGNLHHIWCVCKTLPYILIQSRKWWNDLQKCMSQLS